MRYVCELCGYVYDEAKQGKPFAALPETWTCPLCGAARSAFAPEAAAKSAVRLRRRGGAAKRRRA